MNAHINLDLAHAAARTSPGSALPALRVEGRQDDLLAFPARDGTTVRLLPLALVVLIILSPLILIGVILLWPSGRGKWALFVLPAAFRVFCSLRGLRIDIQSGRESVYISVV